MEPNRPDPDGAALSALAMLTRGLVAGQPGDLSYATVKNAVREVAARDPIDTLLVTVLGGSYLFYLAEKDQNPKVRSFVDALLFISTCLSVGYADVFAVTQGGKAIASFVMSIGPSVSSKLFEPPAVTVPASPESLDVQKAILARLDAIHEALAKP